MEIEEEQRSLFALVVEPSRLAVAVFLVGVDGVGADDPGASGVGNWRHWPAAAVGSAWDEGGELVAAEIVVVEGVAGAEEVVIGGDGAEARGVSSAFVGGRAEGLELDVLAGVVRGHVLGDEVGVERASFGADGVDAEEGESAFFAAEERADDGLLAAEGGAEGLRERVVEVVEVEGEGDAELLEA